MKVLVWTLWLCASLARAENEAERLQNTSPWDVQMVERQIIVPQNGQRHGVHHYLFVPENIQQSYLQRAGTERDRWLWNRFLERETASGVLYEASQFIRWTYQQYQTINSSNEAFMNRELAKIRWGKYPGVVTTEFGNYLYPYEVLFVAPSEANQTPTERFLSERLTSFKSYPRHYEFKPVRVEYISPLGKREVDEEISGVLSRIPRLTGEVVELVKRVRSPDSPFDYTLEQLMDLMSYQALFWSPMAIRDLTETDRRKIRPLEPALLQEALALRKKYPFIPDNLLFPENQTQVVIGQVLFATGSPRNLKYFKTRWNLFPTYDTFRYGPQDSDDVYISLMDRGALYQTVSAALRRTAAATVVDDGELQPTAVGADHCHMLLARPDDVLQFNQRLGSALIIAAAKFRRVNGNSYLYRLFKSRFGTPAESRRRWMELHAP